MLIITAISETANANNHYLLNLIASDLQRSIRTVRFKNQKNIQIL